MTSKFFVPSVKFPNSLTLKKAGNISPFSIKIEFTAEGRITLDGHIYKEFKGSEVFVKELSDAEMSKAYERFGLKNNICSCCFKLTGKSACEFCNE